MPTARDKCLVSVPSAKFVGGRFGGADRLNGLSAYVLRTETNKYIPYLDVEQRVCCVPLPCLSISLLVLFCGRHLVSRGGVFGTTQHEKEGGLADLGTEIIADLEMYLYLPLITYIWPLAYRLGTPQGTKYSATGPSYQAETANVLWIYSNSSHSHLG